MAGNTIFTFLSRDSQTRDFIPQTFWLITLYVSGTEQILDLLALVSENYISAIVWQVANLEETEVDKRIVMLHDAMRSISTESYRNFIVVCQPETTRKIIEKVRV